MPYRAWLEMEEPHWLKAHYDKLKLSGLQLLFRALLRQLR
ncbi:iron-sulfur cluster assembly protein SufB [Klebsiella pneumoniae]|uniref:Iron-sulfur cluster assembly protein SufB n=1 Tax=Klebsiella pneumoniae TaxID=573 RepID=A0A2X3CES1_KLEPN|nr:iron-sulfur cluster assembly protein SufB [Klebsiella pneumoniae]